MAPIPCRKRPREKVLPENPVEQPREKATKMFPKGFLLPLPSTITKSSQVDADTCSPNAGNAEWEKICVDFEGDEVIKRALNSMWHGLGVDLSKIRAANDDEFFPSSETPSLLTLVNSQEPNPVDDVNEIRFDPTYLQFPHEITEHVTDIFPEDSNSPISFTSLLTDDGFFKRGRILGIDFSLTNILPSTQTTPISNYALPASQIHPLLDCPSTSAHNGYVVSSTFVPMVVNLSQLHPCETSHENKEDVMDLDDLLSEVADTTNHPSPFFVEKETTPDISADDCLELFDLLDKNPELQEGRD